MGDSIHLILPMAGEGQRFRREGFTVPKPLIPIGGIPMYQLVLRNLWHPLVSDITLVARREFGLGEAIGAERPNLPARLNVVEVDVTTGGPADSVEMAADLVSDDQFVVVANSDQWIDFAIENFYSALMLPGTDGAILAMQDHDPKWSYVEIDDRGHAVRVVEKRVISNFATVGIYGFRNKQLMLDGFHSMRAAGASVKGEYYVGPSYNFFPSEDPVIRVINLGPIGEKMWGLGTPDDLEQFLKSRFAPNPMNLDD